MSSVLRIIHIIPSREYKDCILLFLLMLIGAVLEAVGISAILPFISIMGNEDFLQQHKEFSIIVEWMGVHEHKEFILCCAVGLIIFYLLKDVFLGIAGRMQVRFAIQNQIFFSQQLLAEYLSKPYLFHVEHNTAILLRNVITGPLVVFGTVVFSVLNIMMEVFTAIAIGIMLLLVDPFTAVIVEGLLCGLIVLIIKSFRRHINRQGAIQNKYGVQYLAWLNQSLGAIKETKVMHTEAYFLRKFDDAYRKFGEVQGGFNFLNQLPRLMIEVIVVSGLLLLIILKIFWGEQPTDIVPMLGLLALAAFRLMPSANRIVSYYNAIKYHMALLNELYPELQKIANKSTTIMNLSFLTEEPKPLPFYSEICINHLAFYYQVEQEILKDITFRVSKGNFVGIIGASGAGKTTFVDVLLGLLPPSQGNITVDGVNIFTNVRGWQENLAYVPQTIYLIDASIKENIALGQDVESIDRGWMEKVLRMSELYDFVNGLQDGAETLVGERGIRLSGGQRQRIGIARALYRRPQVLILDEATSALDTETEKSIMDTILQLKGKITIIAIAHRLSTLEKCDYKIRFIDGICEVVQ